MNEKVNSNMSYEKILSFIKEKITIPDKTKIIYQYTNIEALFNGIIVKDPQKINEEICLWASHYMYLNDPTEIETGQKYFEEILSQYFIEEDNNDAKNDSICDAEYFITSFSTTMDSLPMWSMYGKNGAGIALGFDRDLIHKGSNEVFLYKCVYLDKDVKDKIASFCERYKRKKMTIEALKLTIIIVFLAALFGKNEKHIAEQLDDSGIMSFLLFMMFAKNPAYEYENEIRLLIQPDKDSKISKNKYRCQNNLIIPYIENFFPKKALKEVWIGPTNDRERTKKSLKAYLDYMGFSDVEIKQSEVPYRT
jgi:hypothetical protein